MPLASSTRSQKNASGWPPVAPKNLRMHQAWWCVPQTEGPPSGGPPSIRGWNLRETSHERCQHSTSPHDSSPWRHGHEIIPSRGGSMRT